MPLAGSGTGRPDTEEVRMSSTAGTVALLIVVVTLLVAGFLAFWMRDKSRADEESTDQQRTAPDPNAEHRKDSYRG
jgi:flagellar basal body-associated protein FliL